MPLLADVAVPVPLAHAFTYEVPAPLAASVQPGARVLCAFGRRQVLGVVLDVAERELPFDRELLKPIKALVDPDPILPRDLLAFLSELAAYYFAPIGEVLRLALPAVERERVRALKQQELMTDGSLNRVRQVGGKRVAYARPTDQMETPGTLRGQAAAVLAHLRATGEAPVARIAQKFGNARNALKKLADLGLVTVDEREPQRDPFFAMALDRDTPPTLNEAQAAAVASIETAIQTISDNVSAAPGKGKNQDRPPSAFLLFGVTGSGKTEVYLRAIAKTIERGRGAIVMVPEIALTPQLVARFRARFGDGVAVLHSGLSEVDRHAMWQSLRLGRVRVAIGARSAIFAPVPDLGLIIVDEEHDGSFKQEEGVRYHARDMALLRAHRGQAVAVLGSATPSLESMELVRRKKLVELRLPDRARREANLPDVTLIDLRRIGAGPTGNRLLSLPLHRAIEQTLAAREQVILFLNRRGFAPSVVCDSCGSVETCLACSVALTFHSFLGRKNAPPENGSAAPPHPSGRLRCHYCDYDGPLPGACSACQHHTLALEGLGTERLEQTIAEAFPGARVARLDRDVGGGMRSEAILDRMRAGEIDILVGTQMVTKGHDLPHVTLVGVVNADAALSLPDFRAAERGFSLLVQVAGRAGRSDRPGRVLIQTRTPEHPAIRFAAQHDVLGFLAHELQDRAEVGYPPFTRIALIRIDAADEAVARAVAARMAACARTSPESLARRVEVLGPSPAPLARLRGRYRFRVLLRSPERGPLRAALSTVIGAPEALDRRARIVIDVDPVAML